MGRTNPKNEKDVKENVKLMCKQAGAYYAMPHGAGYGRAGIPDFLICHYGQFIGVETKYAGNKPSANQRRELIDIESANGTALVINETNLADLAKLLGVAAPHVKTESNNG